MTEMTESVGGAPSQLRNFATLERLHQKLGATENRTPAQEAVFMILDRQIGEHAGNVSAQAVCMELDAAAIFILAVKLDIETNCGL
jgi:hypothetical protein